MAGINPIVTDGFLFTPSLIVTRGYGSAVAIVVIPTALPNRIEPVHFETPFIDLPGRTVASQFWQVWITRLIASVNRILAKTDVLVSSTYTPTSTSVTNVDAATPLLAHYSRVVNEVTVKGQIQVDPTAASGTATEVDISLPVSSNLTSATDDIVGYCISTDSAIVELGYVSGDITNDRAKLQFNAASTVNHTLYYEFTYTVK